ncbi:MAG: hypothetical protein ACRDO7_16935 [Nocardioidaceae bacterium]
MPVPQDPESESEPLTAEGDDDTTVTGHRRIDAAIDRLHALDELPVDEHAAVYHDVHEELRSSLTDAGMPADGPGTAS